MYQPYIRGKQFELIGLRELSQKLSSNRTKISPIIEPVKDSSTLKTTLIELARKNVNFTVIINPQKGTFSNPSSILLAIRNYLASYTNFQIGIIFHSQINHDNISRLLNSNSEIVRNISIIHNCIEDDISNILQDYYSSFNIKYNVINLSLTNRRYARNFDRETLVELDDFFNSQSKNSDYLGIIESDFSEEHLYFIEEGFIGFSDYLSIGEEYSESGFLPWAVAIHLSYSDERNRIKIRHFVSDSNGDNTDVAGKFSEALEKLISWCNATNYDSIAIPIFRNYYLNGHFPGLGTLKKLSLMNHIDLVLKLI